MAVSGGADSLLALALLREAGREVLALHGRFFDDALDDAGLRRLQSACNVLGADFAVADLRQAFQRRVVEPFIRAYARGLTPNPCAACNRGIKFGLLLDAALDQGAQTLATGHYVRAGRDDAGRPLLLRGADPAKDQSYFLALVPRKRLARAVFPLGERFKRDTLGELAKRGLDPPLPRPSREICFIPHDDYRRFLQDSGADLSGPGPILLENGTVVGRHHGFWRHTPGQRRGLGVAWSEPLYVLRLDPARNAVVVGPRDRLAVRECAARDVNVLVDPGLWPEELSARIRYRQRARPARARLQGETLRIRFQEPGDPPAPGQLAVLQDGDVILAGGVVASAAEAGGALAKWPKLD
ncbi:MAG: tRNA 2-thiouridine(34) synthase MnmA [Desulfovibrionaceae bacterium]